jgi:hypothetical protein
VYRSHPTTYLVDHLVACDDLIPDGVILGKPDNFRNVAKLLDVPVLGELPLAEGVSTVSIFSCWAALEP